MIKISLVFIKTVLSAGYVVSRSHITLQNFLIFRFNYGIVKFTDVAEDAKVSFQTLYYIGFLILNENDIKHKRRYCGTIGKPLKGFKNQFSSNLIWKNH